MKLRYERGALADLAEIFAYIAADNRPAAARLVARIEDAARRIAATPHMGEAIRESRFRRLPVGNYLIVYEVGSDEVVERCSKYFLRQVQIAQAVSTTQIFFNIGMHTKSIAARPH